MISPQNNLKVNLKVEELIIVDTGTDQKDEQIGRVSGPLTLVR